MRINNQVLGHTALESGDAAMGIACGRLVPVGNAIAAGATDAPLHIIDSQTGADLGICRIEYTETHPQGYVYVNAIPYELYAALFPERREDGL